MYECIVASSHLGQNFLCSHCMKLILGNVVNPEVGFLVFEEEVRDSCQHGSEMKDNDINRTENGTICSTLVREAVFVLIRRAVLSITLRPY